MGVSYNKLSDELKQRVQSRIALRTSRTALIQEGVFDPLKHKILVVGDRPWVPGERYDPDHVYTPFPYVDASSGWLNAYLELENIPESELVWINAYDLAGKPTKPVIIECLEPREIILLGNKAEEWLSAADPARFARSLYAPHPQFWKRFKSQERYPLMDLFSTIIKH